jgi:2-haloacid dehalogenase
MMPHAAVFDVGNVLYHWSLRALFEKLIADPDELDWFLAHVITPEWHFQHDAGRPLDEMVAERCAEFPEHAHLIHAYRARFLESIYAPIAGMHELVAALAARDVPIYGITNFGAEFWDMFRPTAPIFDVFQDIIVSGVEKMVKPDAEIYQLARARFGLGAGEAIFIDDMPANVAGAEAEGFIGHHFTGADRLRAHLAELGMVLNMADQD